MTDPQSQTKNPWAAVTAFLGMLVFFLFFVWTLKGVLPWQ